MLNENVTTYSHRLVANTTVRLPAVVAIIFGAFMVFGTGFAQPTSMHNATHDARHAFTFPCH
jgi:cobalt transporter subunit CbtB